MNRWILFWILILPVSVRAEVINVGAVDVYEMSGIWLKLVTGGDGLSFKGVLKGKLASGIVSLTGTTGPIRATVSRVKKYSPPFADCSRIRMVYEYPGAKLIDGGRKKSTILYESDICLRDYLVRRTINVVHVPAAGVECVELKGNGGSSGN